jgi:hypothetical protein
MLVPPVCGEFRVELAAPDMVPESNVNPNAIDPTCTPDDTASGRPPPTPGPTLHITHVSDDQPVRALPVDPDRTPMLAPPVPNPDPLKLIPPPPVDPELPTVTADTDAESYEARLVIDPPASPAVTVTFKLPPSPDRALQTTMVSDTQPVARAPLDPAPLLTLSRRGPKLDPLTVMPPDPPAVGGMFPRCHTPDSDEAS